MPAPRRKPLLLWEPFPYLVLFVALLATSFVRPGSSPWLFWPLIVVLAASLVYLVISIGRERRGANPDQWGNLLHLDGLTIVDAGAEEREVRAVVPVDGVARHQAAIDLARVHGGAEQQAVLVPRASRWLGRRYRIGVQLVGGDRPRHAGYLPESAEDRVVQRLDAMRGEGRYVRVPALITGSTRPYGVELDLSGIDSLG
ncbi:hypothetical protein ACWKWP_02915 [Agromyces soli]